MTRYYRDTNVKSNFACTGSILTVEIDVVSESIVYMAQYYVDNVHGKLGCPKDF